MLITSLSSAYALTPGASSGDDYRLKRSADYSSVLRPLRHSQNSNTAYRSKSSVVREVKARYKAKVVKISLNEQRGVYYVRVLMPSGKIKTVQVNARR